MTAGADGTARVWDAIPWQDRLIIQEPGAGGIGTATYSPDDASIVTASTGRTARVWNADTGKLTSVTLAEPGGSTVSTVGFSPDGRRILTASFDGSARVWDAANGRPTGTVVEQKELDQASFSPDGSRILTASFFGDVARVWNAGTARPSGSQWRKVRPVSSPTPRSVRTASWS